MNDIQELKRQGLYTSEISVLTGFSRPTVRKYFKEAGQPQYGPRPPRGTKLDPFKDYLQERFSAGAWNAVVLLREFRERGYSGGYSILKDYLRPLRRETRCVAVRRFETPPGHQAQVDWGDVGEVWTQQQRYQLSGFVFTLGHSLRPRGAGRALFADIATDQRLPTLLRLHEAAFTELGGVPRDILYDHMKTVVLGVNERGEIRWHPLFWDFAQYWGFTLPMYRDLSPADQRQSGVGHSLPALQLFVWVQRR